MMTYTQHLAALSACFPKADPALIELAARGACVEDIPITVTLAPAERHKLTDEIVDRVVDVLRSAGGGIRDLTEV
jgi:hypothetical protein